MASGHYKTSGTANPDGDPIVVPPNRGDAVLWIDASDASTIVSTSGATVTELADKAHDITYREDTRMPGTGGPVTGTDTIGGLNAFHFDYTDVLRTHLLSGDPALIDNFAPLNDTNAFSVACVVQADSSSSAAGNLISAVQGPVGGFANDRNMTLAMSSSANRITARAQYNNIYGIDGNNPADFYDSPIVAAFSITLPSRIDDIGNNQVLHGGEVNGEVVDDRFFWSAISNNAGPLNDRVFAPGEIVIGGRPSNSNHGNALNANEQWGGLLGELIVLAGYWSPSEMTGHLAHKWNLTGNLPASHPFKSVAPVLRSF